MTSTKRVKKVIETCCFYCNTLSLTSCIISPRYPPFVADWDLTGMYCKEPIVAFVTAQRLNEYIRHYETLSYPVEDVHRSHLRAKRSISRDSAVTVKFRAHNKNFHIRLKRDLTTFSNNLIIEGPTGERQDSDIFHVYQGNLVGTSAILFNIRTELSNISHPVSSINLSFSEFH